jgi:GxxExxY protein
LFWKHVKNPVGFGVAADRRHGTSPAERSVLENTIIVELKAIETVLPVHRQQVLTYLKHADKPLGLLMNFNVEVLAKGVIRIKNGY